ncbi:MAG: glycosyltransferase family 4 protein [Patescibacteria group bacterium]|jgi:glycosyltransferase involved in cell wall biosynthesis
MKIAILAELLDPVPPSKSGGVNRIAFWLAEGLVKRGHNVTLFASSNSETSAKLVPVIEKSIREDAELCSSGFEALNEHYKNKALDEIVRLQEDFDVIHDNIGWRFLMHASLINKPIVSTIHAPVGSPPYRARIYTEISKMKNVSLVTVSKHQQEIFDSIEYHNFVYNGIDLSKIKFTTEKGNYFVFLGRITEEKGVHLAIEAAKKAGVQLKIAGGYPRLEDKLYFEERIKPQIDNQQIFYVGEVNDAEKSELLAGSIALVNPMQVEEAFGLVMAESMAAGKPAIVYANGSAPELIIDGKTGYLIDPAEGKVDRGRVIAKTGVGGLEQAIRKIDSLGDAEYEGMAVASHNHAREKFDIEKMVDSYERLFIELLRK